MCSGELAVETQPNLGFAISVYICYISTISL